MHLDESVTHVERYTTVTFCVLFLGSWTIFLTAYIIGTQCTVLEMLPLIASMGNEMTLVTVVA
jgi:hypothetical protein